MAIRFLCPHYKTRMTREESRAGQEERCATCGGAFIVPAPAQFCPACGQRNAAGAATCSACGGSLAFPSGPRAVPADGALGGLIPYKNALALWSYYLGVFSLIPCIGYPLGLAAIVTGVMGLRYAGAHPEAKGKIHAWVGIILGSLWFIATAGFLLYMAATGGGRRW